MSTLHDALNVARNRLRALDPDDLTPEQQIQFCLADAALISADAQARIADVLEHALTALPLNLQSLKHTLDCEYRKKHGTWPENEEW